MNLEEIDSIKRRLLSLRDDCEQKFYEYKDCLKPHHLDELHKSIKELNTRISREAGKLKEFKKQQSLSPARSKEPKTKKKLRTMNHLTAKDAMLGKKPLNGWKCATCDSNLVDMNSMPAQYHSWK